MNILELIKKFPTQEACIKHFEKVRWGDEVKCAYCKGENTYPNEKELRHHCNDCRKSFSVTVGTIFHHTHIELQKWFLIMSLMLNAKKGASSYQIARDLGMRQATVWSIMQRVRKAMKTNDKELLSGIIEMDETYVGGKPRKTGKKDDNDKGNPRGRGTKKECVVGMVERGGKVKATSVQKAQIKSYGLKQLVRDNIDMDNSLLITDEYKGYMTMNKIINHAQVNHQKEYVNSYDIHTNTIESFWALLKRGIMGNFHKVSKKYLDNYINEFTYRYNNRDNKNTFNDLLLRMV